MEGISFSSYRRERPIFTRLNLTPEEYLAKERIRLLRSEVIPPDHPLRNRIRRSSGAIMIERSLTGIPREAFTDEELRVIKLQRKTSAPDQNEARLSLKDTNLVNMWNTDCRTREQWAEYDSVQPLMERSMIRSNKPAEAFDPELIVGAKRKRVVSGEERFVRAKSVEPECLEEGEIEQDLDVVKTVDETNEKLRLENEAIMAFLKSKGLDGSPFNQRSPSPPSPSESESGNEKTDGSDDSDLGVETDEDVGCLRDFDELEGNEERKLDGLGILSS